MFSKMVKILMDEENINQREFSEKIGVSKAIVSEWLRDIKTPKLKYIVATANYFKCSCDYLLTGKEYELPDDEKLLIKTWRRMDNTDKELVKLIINKYNS